MKTLIIIVSIIGFTAVFGAIFVGTKSFDGIVTEHPYEKGLIWDEIRNKKLEYGWKVNIWNKDLRTGGNDVGISVTDKYGKPVEDASISLMISRPSTGEYDKYFNTVRVSKGVFKSRVDFPLYGYWDMIVNVTKEGDILPFKERIFVKMERR